MSCSRRRQGRSLALFSVAFLSVLSSGCVTIPEFDKLSGITPVTIVEVVRCELYWAYQDHKELQGYPPWYAVADLTLQIDETTSLTPSFTHTDMVSRSLSRMFNWGVKLDTSAKRIYTQSVTFDIREIGIDENNRNRKRCADRDSIGGVGFALNGRLGLSEIVSMAFEAARYVAGKDRFEPHKYAALAEKEKGSGSKYFGQSLEFVVTKNINKVGPTWVLTFFKGPGGFLTMERGDTNKLLISFSPDKKAATRGVDTLRQEGAIMKLDQIDQKVDLLF
jgi:hypothetical protein